jgi:hypothetical protein
MACRMSGVRVPLAPPFQYILPAVMSGGDMGLLRSRFDELTGGTNSAGFALQRHALSAVPRFFCYSGHLFPGCRSYMFILSPRKPLRLPGRLFVVAW